MADPPGITRQKAGRWRQRSLHLAWRAFRRMHRVRSIPSLVAAIEAYITTQNQNPKPFIWTAADSDILEKVTRARQRLNTLQSV